MPHAKISIVDIWPEALTKSSAKQCGGVNASKDTNKAQRGWRCALLTEFTTRLAPQRI